jgi:hypothetical protein
MGDTHSLGRKRLFYVQLLHTTSTSVRTHLAGVLLQLAIPGQLDLGEIILIVLAVNIGDNLKLHHCSGPLSWLR